MLTVILVFILMIIMSILFILYTGKNKNDEYDFDIVNYTKNVFDDDLDIKCGGKQLFDGLPVIPLNIFQTWHTKHLPPFMAKCVASLKRDNPEFTHYLFDDKDCRKYIYDNYNEDVGNAFDSLIPGAYKADLWRYCVLYKEGGIYLDIKYKCVDGFKLMELTDDEYFVKDRPDFIRGRKAIYNAFMVCKAGNTILKKCIDEVVANVRIKYYGSNPLEPTGPMMMVKLFTPNLFGKQILTHNTDIYDDYFIIRNNKEKILTVYSEYREEQKKEEHTKYYDLLWRERNIYNK